MPRVASSIGLVQGMVAAQAGVVAAVEGWRTQES
jgi:hypothetical protein